MSVKNIIPGTGYFCVCGEGSGYNVVFPDAILVEINDCEVKMTGLLDGSNLDLLEELPLRRTCTLFWFERVLAGRTKAVSEVGAGQLYKLAVVEEAEQLIYELEAHGVILAPSIHRKYKPLIHQYYVSQ